MLFVPIYPILDFSKIQPVVKQVSVSGISSGAYMAGQLHISHSSVIQNATLFAGGPYFCSEGSSLNAINNCMKTKDAINTNKILSEISSLEDDGLIDPLSNLKDDKVLLINGKRDDVVNEQVSKASYELLSELGIKKLTYNNSLNIAHTFPTLSKGNDCKSASSSPYISACGIDGAKIVFKNISNKVSPPKEVSQDRFFYVNQWSEDLFAPYYLSTHAVAYVPKICELKSCKLHVSFHGCKQSRIEIGEQFITDTGLTQYAQANDTILLFPQTIPNYLWNPNGCWDWWGYSGSQFHTKKGTQVKTVFSIIKKFLK